MCKGDLKGAFVYPRVLFLSAEKYRHQRSSSSSRWDRLVPRGQGRAERAEAGTTAGPGLRLFLSLETVPGAARIAPSQRPELSTTLSE